MRIILYTGKGGVGKTSIAAATAIQCAAGGKKTLVVSTDRAHSLGDALEMDLSPEPAEIRPNLWAQEIDVAYELEKGWGRIQKYITALFASNGVQDITVEELIFLPGMEDLLSLLRILKHYQAKTFDVIVIDCAPTGETLALLSFPEMLGWWMNKLFPIQKKAAKILRPVSKPVLGVKLPDDAVFNDVEKLYYELNEMRQLFCNRELTSVRIVVNPEKMVIKEAQRSFTYLNIYDFNVDAVIVNRVIPDTVSDKYMEGWKKNQKKYLDMIKDSFFPLPLYSNPLCEEEIVGFETLAKVGAGLFPGEDPAKVLYNIRTQTISKEQDGYTLNLYLPFMNKEDLALSQKGEELIVKAGNVKRNIVLPRTLQNLSILGAKFEAETLKIRFGGAD